MIAQISFDARPQPDLNPQEKEQLGMNCFSA
jgi:hypothetical protein